MTDHDDAEPLPKAIRTALRAPVQVPPEVRRRHLDAALGLLPEEAVSASSARGRPGSPPWRWAAVAAAVIGVVTIGAWLATTDDVRSTADRAAMSAADDVGTTAKSVPSAAEAGSDAESADTGAADEVPTSLAPAIAAAPTFLGGFDAVDEAKSAAIARVAADTATSSDAAARSSADTSVPAPAPTNLAGGFGSICTAPPGRTAIAEYEAEVAGSIVQVQVTADALGQLIAEVVDPVTCARS